jgi:2-polyprenyl-3-methyl-5-hydroxy-6-metoxy-1,4-benzoquinol methylase
MRPQRREHRFKFGENWLQFAVDLDSNQIIEATKSLSRLIGRDQLDGLSLLDIGCGSGLFSLAARKMGARVRSFDLDPDSVSCAHALRDRYYPHDPHWIVERGSILDSDYTGRLDKCDIVYSWGVLHHTGTMWAALDRAAGLVAPSGIFAVALYRKTPLCWAWHIEKRVYVSAPAFIQSVLRGVYKTAFFSGKAALGGNPFQYVRDYKSNRGMDWHHDVHDWLGGYPYESANADIVKSHMTQLGFRVVRTFERPAGVGLFGTGCDEFVFQAEPTTVYDASIAGSI